VHGERLCCRREFFAGSGTIPVRFALCPFRFVPDPGSCRHDRTRAARERWTSAADCYRGCSTAAAAIRCSPSVLVIVMDRYWVRIRPWRRRKWSVRATVENRQAQPRQEDPPAVGLAVPHGKGAQVL